jgi:hypothetical protein
MGKAVTEMGNNPGEKRILYMGTPEFALAPLKYLLDKGLCISGAVCRPDAHSGRGQKLCPPCVKLAAGSRSIPVFQPVTLKNGAFTASLKIATDCCCCIGMILPKYVLTRQNTALNCRGRCCPNSGRGAGAAGEMNGGKSRAFDYVFIGRDGGGIIGHLNEIGKMRSGELARFLK